MKLQARNKALPIWRWALLKKNMALKSLSILLFLSSFQVSAEVYAQEKVSLHIKNASLETVLKQISKQTDYFYVFQDHWKGKAKTIDISVTNVSIEDALDICFKDQPFTYTIIKKTIVVKEKEEKSHTLTEPPTSALTNIHGRVVDENNQPLIGITVTIKGTKTATSTDNTGDFNFQTIEAGSTLIFTGINVETYELKVKNNGDFTVKLSLKAKQLSSVAVEVNTGYQKLPKERLTGSFDIIDNNTLNQQTGSNILNRLDGVASGVIFPKQSLLNTPPTVLVRGFSTINGPKDPLIVLDNFPYEGDINNINPNDIENVTVLKDAAAASIWGVRAGNGVIVITTKKGKLNQPLKFDLNSNVIISQKPNLGSLRTISSSDYIDIEQNLFNKEYYNGYLNNFTQPGHSPVVEILNNETNGIITAQEANVQIDALRKIDIRDQFSRYMYQQAVTQQYAINLHGGSENIAYYLSAGYDKTIDLLAAPSDRLTIRLDNSYTPVKNLQISVGVQYTQNDATSGKSPYGSIAVNSGQWQIPYLQFIDKGGNALPVASKYREGYVDTAGGGKLLDWKYYPLTDYKHTFSRSKSHDLLANIGASFQLFNDFNIELKYSYEHQQSDDNFVHDKNSFYTRDLINLFTQVDNGIVNQVIPFGDIINPSSTTIEAQNVRGQLNYSHRFNNNSITIIGGGEIRQTHTTGVANTIYGYDSNLGFSNVDFANPYPTYITQNNSYIPNGLSLTDQMLRYVSYYINGAYTFDNKYTISASGRKDGSNLFGVSTNNKWNPLWSAGLAWQVSNESFYHADWLPMLKLRATYGFGGNISPGLTAVTTTRSIGPVYPTNFQGASIVNFPNPELRAEKIRTINIGVDFQSSRQIISGTAEAFFKKGIDLYGPVPYDATDGLNLMGTITRNASNIKGNGTEITLNTKNINKKFKWLTTFLFNYTMSKTTNYYIDTSLRSNSFISSGHTINPIVGKPLYSIVAFKWAGLDALGNPQGYVDSKISEDYNTIVNQTLKTDLIYKAAIPVYSGSLINTFILHGFTLTANINYRLGYYFVKPSLSYSSLYNNGATIGSSDYQRRWQNPGDEKRTNIPSAVYPADGNRDIFYTYSGALIDKADNVKLQYINLGYDISRAVWRTNPFQHLQLYINANNLGTLWKANKDGIDPDYISTVPDPKSFTIGIKANF